MINFKKVISVLLIFLISFSFVFSADTTTASDAEPYNKEEFPQALKDIRRFEIITLGSMPFVMLDVNMVYSAVLKSKGEIEKFSPLKTSNYTTEQQKKLILTSLTVSAGVGLTDFIYQTVKRTSKEIKMKKKKNDSVLITPIEEDPDAIKIALPEEDDVTEVIE